MGLDVSAYKNIELVTTSDEEGEENDDLIYLHVGDFKEQAGDLVSGYYSYSESDHFCRMGYGNYSNFRNELAKLGGWNKRELNKPDYYDPDFHNKNYYYNYPYVADIYMQDSDEVFGNFVEVICFSDCEGVIDSKTCDKLLKDFENKLAEAEIMWEDNPQYLKFYKGLMEAFRFGADKGVVIYG